MTQASNQLASKTKVVDLLSLYNFYFGQTSVFNMKFWSFVQSNFDQNHFKRVQLGTVPFLFSLGSPSISTFASPRVTPASSSPLKRPRCRVDRQVHFRFSVPLPFPVRSSQWRRASRRSPLAAGIRAGQACRPFSIPCTPTLLASPRTSNALPRARIRSSSAGIAPATAGRH